jgi:hypothetical protein
MVKKEGNVVMTHDRAEVFSTEVYFERSKRTVITREVTGPYVDRLESAAYHLIPRIAYGEKLPLPCTMETGAHWQIGIECIRLRLFVHSPTEPKAA